MRKMTLAVLGTILCTCAAWGQTSTLTGFTLSPAVARTGDRVNFSLTITNTGPIAWSPVDPLACRFFSKGPDYGQACRPWPTGVDTFSLRMEAHQFGSADFVYDYWIADFVLPKVMMPGETVVMTDYFTANLPPGRYRLATITSWTGHFAYTSRVLNSAQDSLDLGATADLVVVSDVTPPAVSYTGLLGGACQIWPPNHKLIDVGSISATDGDSGMKSLDVAITSNDPTMTAEDVVVNGTGITPRQIQLRAEKAAFRPGRIYTVAVTASDNAGNVASTTRTCTVPHDQSGN